MLNKKYFIQYILIFIYYSYRVRKYFTKYEIFRHPLDAVIPHYKYTLLKFTMFIFQNKNLNWVNQ